MYEKLTECPVCASDNIKNHKVVIDHSISKESFVIMICDNCSFQFTNPRPTQESIGKFYDSAEYISHTNKANTPINLIYKLVRKYSTRNKVQLLKAIAKKDKGRVLDYGAGTGYFLKAVKKSGWSIYGVEPDNSARQIAEETTGTKIASSLDDLKTKNKKLDVITMWHVLEHIHDINQVFIQLKSLLKEKGKMIIAVPNIASLDNSIYNEEWAAYDVPRHLYHFNQESMKTFIMKHGMRIKRTYPMRFDSYYISMLSEKYKSGKTNYLKSFINGYKSNSYGESHKNNFSSIIYEVKK